jgi:hypothetical protein
MEVERTGGAKVVEQDIIVPNKLSKPFDNDFLMTLTAASVNGALNTC